MNTMKHQLPLTVLLLLATLFLAPANLFANDYREVIFGNSYGNSNEIQDDALLTVCKNGIENEMRYGYRYNGFHLYEENHGKEAVYRFVASGNPLTYENAVKGYLEGTGAVFQSVCIRKNGRIYKLSGDYIIGYESGDGTVRSWHEKQYGGAEVIHRGGKIVGLLTHKAADRETRHSGDGDDDSDIFTTYEKECSAVFYFWSELTDDSYFKEHDDGIFRLKREIEIPRIRIWFSYPLVEEKHPFKYTIQNAFECYASGLYKGAKYKDTCIAELDFMLDNGRWLFGGQ